MKTKKDTKKDGEKVVKKIVTTTTTIVTTTTEVVPKETHYLLVLDESGSMGSVRQETLNGLNEQIQTIKALEKKFSDQKFFVSLVKFHSSITTVFADVPASNVKELTLDDYNPDQMTALHDAMGLGITALRSRIQKKLDAGEATALVVVMTDGQENQSREYNALKIKSIIDELNKTNLWTFSFLGANQDAVLTAQNFGISAGNSLSYTSSAKGSKAAFTTMSNALYSRSMSMNVGDYSNVGYTSAVASSDVIGEEEVKSLLDTDQSVDDSTDKK